ncbi:MAG: hypothetical protein KIS87_01235 [Phycisphaeraceae bacterium]|nr:hypothetical protein [Phycisphaeraceae bacterium]
MEEPDRFGRGRDHDAIVDQSETASLPVAPLTVAIENRREVENIRMQLFASLIGCVVCAILHALAFSESAVAQPSSGPTRCVPLQPAECLEVHSVSYDYDVIVETWTTQVGQTEYKGGWKINQACNCFYGPCEWRATCTELEFEYSRQEQVCWGVSASVSVDAQTGLLSSLFAKLNVSVNIGGNFNACKTYTETRKFAVGVSHCSNVAVREAWEVLDVAGYVVEAETVAYYECTVHPGYIVVLEAKCGERVAQGHADAISLQIAQNAPHRPECGGPDPPDEQYDGMFREACCQPLCGDPLPDPPCCGCYSDP